MTSPKADAVINWISHGLVRVHVDATRPDVTVPDHVRTKDNVVFEWGFEMSVPITDMKIDHEAISGTLSFGDYGFIFCELPWAAVFCISSPVLDRGGMWLNDAPAKIRRDVLRAIRAKRRSGKRKGPALRLVKGGG